MHQGEHYQIPYRGADATGLGKPVKSILHGRADLPIYLAAIGPKNVELAAEIADGWLPIFFSPRHYDAVLPRAHRSGLCQGGGKTLRAVRHRPLVCRSSSATTWTSAAAMVKPILALYIGGMGARGKNFYNDLACRYGYAEAARTVQDLYLAGNKGEAMNAIPDALVDDVALCGPKERIAERLELWRKCPITTMNIMTFALEGLRVMAELML